MNPTEYNPAGFLGSLRLLGEGLLATVHSRFELFTVELQEEKIRFIQVYLWVTVAIFSGILAVIFGSITLVYIFWATARLPVLAGLTVLYAGGAVGVSLILRRLLLRQPRPFAATLSELRADRTCLSTIN